MKAFALRSGPARRGVGIVGFGRFGRLAARYLAPDHDLIVYSRSASKAHIEQTGGRPATLEHVCGQAVVILCVPISAMQATLQRIASLLAPDTLVVDVCSVKVMPCEWMRAILPPSVSILATHPMFGPDSAGETLSGAKIFLSAERIVPACYAAVKTYLTSKGLIIVEGRPAEHDRQIALSLSLTHYIGRSLAAMGAGPLDIDTEGYKRLLHILSVVEHDTWQLFEDMHRYNPFATETRRAFTEALGQIEAKLEKK